MNRARSLELPTDFFIDRVRRRPLDGRDLEFGEIVEQHPQFDVYEANYQSDGLRISGLAGVPRSDHPFPAVVINHGFFPPENYNSGKGTMNELRALASRGYLTIAPDYRNYGESDRGDNTFQPGFLHDVRNLVPALAEREEVDDTRIAMMGHSMGAGLTLQCLATGSDVRVAALLGAVTGREAERYDARLNRWSHGSGAAARGLDEFTERFGSPDEAPETFERMSVINYLHVVETPIIMHHGEMDEVCPLDWATAIRDTLKNAGKKVEFHLYHEAGHVFRENALEVMIERTDRFFRTHMSIES